MTADMTADTSADVMANTSAEVPSPRHHHRRAGLTLLVAAALTGTLGACGGAAAQQPSAPVGADVSQRARPAALTELTELARQDVDAGAPGVIVRVDDGHGRPIEIARQVSWSRADHTLAAKDEFRMGSNTKTMVATVVLQLVAEHRLKLSDPVDAWLPGLVPDGSAITVRMLLNHTSGLFDYTDDPDVLKAFTGQDTRIWTPQELIAAGVRHDPLFAPGTDYAYSNTNYVALGLVAEKATGHTLGDLIQQRIAGPLHLRNTYLVTGADTGPDSKKSPVLAHGYEPDAARLAPLLPPGTPAGTAFAGPARSEGYVDTTWVNASTEWAAGGMVSTARDWARFDSALLSGKLLPAAQLKEMKTTVAEESEFPNRRYGLGLEKVVTPCGTVWGHNGQVPGYSSEAYTDATGRRTASVLTSTIFGLASPKSGAANQAVVNAAVCTMLGKPIPATAASPAA
ncbi:D-alanyl-D-alanine carboxypeptidase [Streptomyces aurantiacus]|uniref:serine hydrolase domain-containing protein n=1 Tax=Streptomyces aurantiacus TaxID=47760 RepID=UPI00278DCE8F|nr:serine hydrolase domain-containing protein [Streptomyces aurantiacus]MDQ0776388.1 D-alanyl-D-alanine carboxypeptidase [Streptomyces aurantiacus]